ncbi:hypothetical protein [Tistrella mobilis]|uniref:ACT domain-containing protein n=1 Tax=Tistrella mobilis (strain KA081020-065) TaxID=1110502 RepID=I3TQG7_TISMK|nr:hypothetical protein [Tistrella mobilis]AFK55005.1 hypothetical protein TMO_3167 [Tistrella mobilis KA081020-065]MAM74977.1 hypothetical protein [Tistrella sp.]
MLTATLSTTTAHLAPAAEAVAPATACFFVVAAAEVGTMSRVLEVFALRSLLPSRWHSQRVGGRADEVHIDVQLDDVVPGEAEKLARKLRQLVEVRQVLITFKAVAD